MLLKKINQIVLILLVIPAFFASTFIKHKSTFKPAASPGFAPGTGAKVPVTSLITPFEEIAEPDLTSVEPAADPQQMVDTLALMDFVAQVTGNNPDLVTGVFLNSRFAYPVVQQPPDSTDYISTKQDEVTQFAAADEHGTTGILAHNYLAGASFFYLSLEEDIYVVFGDGTAVQYTVTQIRSFRALQPDSPYSDFIDQETGAQYTANDVFLEIYGDPGRLVLQTCIASEDAPNWGRLFVIAEQVD
jgi:hypothetical protein